MCFEFEREHLKVTVPTIRWQCWCLHEPKIRTFYMLMVCCMFIDFFFSPLRYPQNLIFGAVASGDHHRSAFHTTPQRLLYNPVQHHAQAHTHPVAILLSLFLSHTPTAEVRFVDIELLIGQT